MIVKKESNIQELIKFCNESEFFSLVYENLEIDEIVFRINKQSELFLIAYKKGFFWMLSKSSQEISYLKTEEVLDILSEENKKFILFNLDLF